MTSVQVPSGTHTLVVATGLGLALGGPQTRVAAPRAEPVERLGLAAALDAVGDVLGERGPVLEPVARAAAEEPPARVLGMAGDEEVRVEREVVLADA